MSDLAKQTCKPCSGDAPLATSEQTNEHMRKLANWNIVELGGIKRLTRVFKFKNFQEALTFANRIGEIAETENHHPAILLEWGKVTVSWWSHKIKGLHVNDFIMAAKTDELAE